MKETISHIHKEKNTKTNIARRGIVFQLNFPIMVKKYSLHLSFHHFIAAKEARDQGEIPSIPTPQPKFEPRKTPKIGLPGYRVAKQRNPDTKQYSLLFEISYPKIEEGLQPRHRLMSCYEQKKEPPNPKFRYLLFAAEPYETIAFKIPSWDIERDVHSKQNVLYTNWDYKTMQFTVSRVDNFLYNNNFNF